MVSLGNSSCWFWGLLARLLIFMLINWIGVLICGKFSVSNCCIVCYSCCVSWVGVERVVVCVMV